MSTPSSIATSAACYCFDEQKSWSIGIYLLASKVSLLGQTPLQLATTSKCYCFDDATARNVAAYLLAVNAGVSSMPPSSVALSASCFCYDEATFRSVMLYLLSQSAGTLSTTPSGLDAAAICYCFDRETSIRVAIYLLAVSAGLQNLTQSALGSLAKCFCFDRATWKKVVAYLMNAGGGGGGGFDPSQLSGLVLRLESSSLVGLTNGSTVHTWTDAGPNGWNYNDSQQFQGPTITTGVFGSLPGVTFDNVVTSQSLGPAVGATLGIAQNVSGFTIFSVAKWSGAGTNGAFQDIFGPTVNGSTSTSRALLGVNVPNWISRARRLDADAGAQSAVAATANVGVVVASQTDYVGGTTTVWLQGVAGTPQALASSGGNSSNTTSGVAVLGADGTNSAPPNGEGFPGIVGAVLCYNRALNSTEIGQVTTWLRNKYSV